MSQEAEVDMKEVELNELEPEKQPMNAAAPLPAASGGEKNGVVKVKVADDETEAVAGSASAKFTGLSKEELLKVAGSPGWVRTRWALLLLFWLGWLGMLAGAVVIIVQAPRCRELPAQRWWQQGALYRISSPKAFRGQAGNTSALAGVSEHLDYLSSLKVKALILGPIHKNPQNDLAGTNLLQIDPTVGSQEEFTHLLEAAKKKNIRIILDLTPNYQSENSWFLPNQSEEVNGKMKEALSFWLKAGVNGIQVHDVQNLTDAASFLPLWSNFTHGVSEDRVFIAGTEASDLSVIGSLLNDTDLLSSSYLGAFGNRISSGKELKELVTDYLDAAGSKWSTWTASQVGHLTSYVPAQLLGLYHLLLFTLPGTPIFNYGDEIGLAVALLPGQPAEAPMLWDEKTLGPYSSISPNMTVQGQDTQPGSLLSLFRELSDKRGKERSLLHGDFLILPTPNELFAYVRHWDQNERFLVVLNLGPVNQQAQLTVSGGSQKLELPEKAALVLSTQRGPQEGTMVPLSQLPVLPGEGLLLRFPYEA
ncbi:4F2 cell-surface antigen heavy chain [Antechinus flavipes]|uniref:4F2 cell-surface antigen heavy chain n=1 Tax=Antechinus flavipes TaxID=38775 RepID=UPI002235FC32|nr:4F2 cell-surface antigen heavy chain [Antechinus flavipes]XP_051823028.1 4F2 cell-surface antigen heavy chain [Antechinus flavipes]